MFHFEDVDIEVDSTSTAVSASHITEVMGVGGDEISNMELKMKRELLLFFLYVMPGTHCTHFVPVTSSLLQRPL